MGHDDVIRANECGGKVLLKCALCVLMICLESVTCVDFYKCLVIILFTYKFTFVQFAFIVLDYS